MLPTIKLGDLSVSRLIIGGNPFSGNSHISRQMDAEMIDYFTAERIKKTLARSTQHGINTAQLRADAHIARLIREFRLEGGRINWIAQTAPEMASLAGSVRNLMKQPQFAPDAIYLQGTVTDALFKAGQQEKIRQNLAVLRQSGLPTGLGSHMPEVISQAEEEGWDLDFYVCSVYNLSRIDRVSSSITGQSNEDEPFFPEDIPVMYKVIRAVQKPCLAFKILGAGRRCQSQATVEAAFREAFANIKTKDAVVVGMYPKDMDQVALNAAYTRAALATGKKEDGFS